MDVMDYTLSEWINLLLRWAHVFAAILWIGTTYFFTWLDGAFSRRDDVWLVHSGGFYIVKKEKLVAGVAGHLLPPCNQARAREAVDHVGRDPFETVFHHHAER